MNVTDSWKCWAGDETGSVDLRHYLAPQSLFEDVVPVVDHHALGFLG